MTGPFLFFFCSMRDPPLRGTLVRGIRNPNDQPSGQTLPSYSTLPRSHSHDQPQTVIRHTIILEHTCAESQDLSASRSTSGPPSPLSVLQVAWMLTECKARKPESNRSHGTGQTDMCTHTHKHTDRHVHTHARIPQARRIFIFITAHSLFPFPLTVAARARSSTTASPRGERERGACGRAGHVSHRDSRDRINLNLT